MTENKMGIKAAGKIFFIGNSYDEVKKTLKDAFEGSEVDEGTLDNGEKYLEVGFVHAYFNENNKLYQMEVDNGNFEGYQAIVNGKVYDFEDDYGYIETLPKIFKICGADMDISYCDKDESWYYSTSDEAVFDDSKKNADGIFADEEEINARAEADKEKDEYTEEEIVGSESDLNDALNEEKCDGFCNDCEYCSSGETHLMTNIDDHFEIYSECHEHELIIFALAVAGTFENDRA